MLSFHENEDTVVGWRKHVEAVRGEAFVGLQITGPNPQITPFPLVVQNKKICSDNRDHLEQHDVFGATRFACSVWHHGNGKRAKNRRICNPSAYLFQVVQPALLSLAPARARRVGKTARLRQPRRGLLGGQYILRRAAHVIVLRS
jgi:hypothetical protein